MSTSMRMSRTSWSIGKLSVLALLRECGDKSCFPLDVFANNVLLAVRFVTLGTG